MFVTFPLPMRVDTRRVDRFTVKPVCKEREGDGMGWDGMSGSLYSQTCVRLYR